MFGKRKKTDGNKTGEWTYFSIPQEHVERYQELYADLDDSDSKRYKFWKFVADLAPATGEEHMYVEVVKGRSLLWPQIRYRLQTKAERASKNQMGSE